MSCLTRGFWLRPARSGKLRIVSWPLVRHTLLHVAVTPARTKSPRFFHHDPFFVTGLANHPERTRRCFKGDGGNTISPRMLRSRLCCDAHTLSFAVLTCSARHIDCHPARNQAAQRQTNSVEPRKSRAHLAGTVIRSDHSRPEGVHPHNQLHSSEPCRRWNCEFACGMGLVKLVRMEPGRESSHLCRSPGSASRGRYAIQGGLVAWGPALTRETLTSTRQKSPGGT